MFALVLHDSLLFLGRLGAESIEESLTIDGEQVNVIRYPSDGRTGEDVSIADPAFVEYAESQWSFRNDPPVVFGGMNPSAVRHTTDSLDSTIEVAWNYYFGGPLLLDGWIIPLHRHPAWNSEAIRAAWRRQTVLTAKEWGDRVKKDLAALERHEWRSDREPNVNPFAFCQLASTAPQTFSIFLRMDCREVCRVEHS